MQEKLEKENVYAMNKCTAKIDVHDTTGSSDSDIFQTNKFFMIN